MPQNKLLMVIPTYNEALVIEKNIRTVLNHLEKSLGDDDWRLVVADNGSTDETQSIVQSIHHPRLQLWTTNKKGRGHALRSVWQEFDADVYAYMDADLATDLNDLPSLVALVAGADLVVGSRLHPDASIDRSLGRELLSRVYSWLTRVLLSVPVKDLQCGFKAIKKEAAKQILPLTSHDGWFFDTELIALTHHHGFRVRELPVRWQEAPDRRRKSSVKILHTVWDDLKELWKLRKRLQKGLN